MHRMYTVLSTLQGYTDPILGFWELLKESKEQIPNVLGQKDPLILQNNERNFLKLLQEVSSYGNVLFFCFFCSSIGRLKNAH